MSTVKRSLGMDNCKEGRKVLLAVSNTSTVEVPSEEPASLIYTLARFISGLHYREVSVLYKSLEFSSYGRSLLPSTFPPAIKSLVLSNPSAGADLGMESVFVVIVYAPKEDDAK